MKALVEKFGKKQVIVLAVVGLYLLGSLIYIGADLWNKFQVNVMQASYQQGKSDTVQLLITQAENKECKAFPVYAGEKQIELINTACLQQKAGEK